MFVGLRVAILGLVTSEQAGEELQVQSIWQVRGVVMHDGWAGDFPRSCIADLVRFRPGWLA